MKSLPVPVAHARNNFSDVLDNARQGKRIRITRHGKAVGWIIGPEEREVLESAQRGKPPRPAKSRRG